VSRLIVDVIPICRVFKIVIMDGQALRYLRGQIMTGYLDLVQLWLSTGRLAQTFC